jgi:hypothetical protein
MSDDTPISPNARFLLHTRDLIINGKSAYGDPNSPAAQAQLAEVDAKLGLMRQLGEAPPPPEPWTVQRAARERVQQEFPGGDPAAMVIPDIVDASYRAKFAALATLSGRALANRFDEVDKDIAGRASAVTLRHGAYDPATGTYPGGGTQAAALLRDAEPAVAQFAKNPAERDQIMRTLRADRRLLEAFATRGQAMTRYADRRKELGV